jgi:radical SAM superfamily enzyme YgiQ (UPF0313 family)
MSSVLFIYPPISFKERSALSAYSPPLGALYLGTILKNGGHEVHVIDADAEQLSLSQIRRRVRSIDPDVVGLTCLTLTLDSCKAIIKEVRNTTDAHIVVGGPHAGVAPETSLKKLGADAYIIGEAESAIKEVVEKKPRGVIHAKEIMNIDSIPFPDRSLVEHIQYGRFYGMEMVGNVTGILTTRGCRYACTYCNRPKKSCFRSRSPKNILQELKELDRMGFESVWIADDNFTNNPQNVIKLARLIKKEKLKFHFFGEARVDAASEALYKSMRSMGIVGLGYGVESLNPEVVKWYNKTRYPEKWPTYVKRTLELCDKHGIIFLGSLIFGAPMETKEDMEHSIDFLEKNGADFMNGNILMYLVGSAIWNWGRKIGKIRPDQYMALAPELGLTPYSEKELEGMCTRCTDFTKKEGWKSAMRKVLKSRRFDLISYGLKKYIRHYLHIRKVRKEVYRYGYGKDYTTEI